MADWIKEAEKKKQKEQKEELRRQQENDKKYQVRYERTQYYYKHLGVDGIYAAIEREVERVIKAGYSITSNRTPGGSLSIATQYYGGRRPPEKIEISLSTDDQGYFIINYMRPTIYDVKTDKYIASGTISEHRNLKIVQLRRKQIESLVEWVAKYGVDVDLLGETIESRMNREDRMLLARNLALILAGIIVLVALIYGACKL
jgi:hypothetical protein